MLALGFEPTGLLGGLWVVDEDEVHGPGVEPVGYDASGVAPDHTKIVHACDQRNTEKEKKRKRENERK